MADPNKFPAPTVVPNPPKNDPISTSQLAKANGVNGAPIWIAIKGIPSIYPTDVISDMPNTRLQAVYSTARQQRGDLPELPHYHFTGPYHVFAGMDIYSQTPLRTLPKREICKDASKGLGLSSVKPEDAVADYSSLGPAEVKVLDDWLSFFQKRYNQIGRVSA
ncbi:hypothetical protein FRB99_005560 [Tulasnella sp. 403]|nr:hypothetical protein FRB99_005560 [Tulasnella sp. 403]